MSKLQRNMRVCVAFTIVFLSSFLYFSIVRAACDSVYGCGDVAGNTVPLSPGQALDSLKGTEGLQGIETEGTAIDAIISWTNFALGFVGVLAVAYIVYAGFLHITAGGEEDKVKQSNKMIFQAVIGIIIIISAYAIVNTFLAG